MRALQRWFDKFSGGDVYLIFRLLIPEIDLGRVYYLKEKRLAGLFCGALGCAETSRGRKLANWRVEERNRKSQGDLSAVIYDVVASAEHWTAPILSVGKINTLLDSLVTCKRLSGGFTQFDVTRGTPIIESLYREMTSLECKWITRIILKDLQLRIDPKTFFDSFHGWMWRIYSTKNDLKLACDTVIEMIKKGHTSASKLSDEEYRKVHREFFSLQIGTNIAIMACGRANGLHHVVERMKGSTCYVEKKYDGERLQAHLCKAWPEKIRIFSKSGRNSTQDRFRCHEQLLKALKFTNPLNTIESIIVDGELLVFNELTCQIENFGTVQDLQAWKSNYRGDIMSGDRHYVVILFDLLHLNGQDLTFKPLEFRRRLLETLVVVEPNRVELTKLTTIDLSKPVGIETLNSIYAQALTERWEGLIIKKCRSSYLPGNRGEWLKLKKDYIEGFGDTAEFAVVGLLYGKARNGLLNTLVIGALTNKVEMEADPLVKAHFLLLFTVSQGLTEEEASLFHERLKQTDLFKAEANLQDYKYEFAPGFRCALDYLVRDPFLAELLGSGFVKERGQPHYVLRFPRIRRIFFDRAVQASISFQELQEMAVASFTAGNHTETVVQAGLLAEHSDIHKAGGKRAPEVVRPDRLVFKDEVATETPSKLIKRMFITEKEPSVLDQLTEKEPSISEQLPAKGPSVLKQLIEKEPAVFDQLADKEPAVLDRQIEKELSVPDQQTVKEPSVLDQTAKEPSVLDQLRSDYFFHVPTWMEGYDDLIDRMEALGLETLYHLVAVASCENRNGVVILPDDVSLQSEIFAQLRELGVSRPVQGIKLYRLRGLLEASEQFKLDFLEPLFTLE